MERQSFTNRFKQTAAEIAQDKDFLNAIKTQKDAILRNDKTSGEFPRYKDWKASNLHYAIGHYDLRNGYLDNRGNLHIQMFDTYEFNKNNPAPLNQAGRSQMIKGNLKPYFSIHDIIVPNYVIRDLWK